MSRRNSVAEMFAADLANAQDAGEVETVGALKIHRETVASTGCPAVRIWRGKASKPFVNLFFRTAERRELYIASTIESEQRRELVVAARKKEKAERVAAMRDEVQAGTILHRSWGYDQTTNDFYQVVERRGAYAVIRKIGKTVVEGSDQGFMCCRVKPVRDKFTSEPSRRLIGEWGVSVGQDDHARPCDPAREYSETWYA